ncbi:MAG: type II secretion system GspH family protein [Deltaproteobacteria bacterium]|jgi:general secretion pathway protein H|nr:type II secretion system GspH family protein [Deltaproteobacteria bacterium]MCW8893279.1 type II secretion system GspH family protein [Deltaproteobacteria bacterium]MCW9050315.1 type II secretion system GspH family protein [Deltaproteobacteria bacterium]
MQISIAGISNKSSGFTLVELLIVLFMVSIFTIFVIPRFSHIGEGNLNHSARRLSWTIKQLFNEAALSSMEHRIIYDLDRGSYRATILEPDGRVLPVERFPEEIKLKQGIRFMDVTIAGRGTFSNGEVVARILPSGWLEETIVHFVGDNDKILTLQINPLTGHSETYDGYREFGFAQTVPGY